MDENIDIQSLVQKYEQMCASGKKIYFDPEEFALLAEHYNTLGDDDTSVSLIEEGLVMHPTNPELMLLKAKILVFGEKYDEAMEYMKNMADDSDVEVILLRIESFLHLNKPDDAKKLVDETLDSLSNDDSNKEEFYYFICELGYLYNDVDQFDNAILFLAESLTFDYSNPEALVDLAYAYEMKGDFEKAIEYNNNLLDLDPYSFDGWVNIGKLYSMCDQFDKALDAFDFALTIKENDLSVLKMKGLTLYLSGNPQDAIRLFENCLKETLRDETLYNSLLEAYEAMEQYDEVLKLLRKKEEIFGSAGITAKRAFIYIAKGDIDTAKFYFNLIPGNEKDTLDYYMLEGELAFLDNELMRSEIAYLKAAILSEENEDILDRLANISVAQEKFEQAAEYLQQLLELSPDYPTAKARLAFIRFEIGTKEPFDEIMNHFSDEELHALLHMIEGKEEAEQPEILHREKILMRLNEARENRVLFRNIKY